jgi:iron complex transport system permease protein
VTARRTFRPAVGLSLLAGCAVLAAAVSLTVGAVAIPPGDVLRALLSGGGGTAGDIVRGIRLPRTVAAFLAGLALSTSGVVFQAMLRNPLADPYLLGVSSGAALGAVSALAFGLAASFPGSVPLAALAGAGVAALAVYALAVRDGGLPPHTLILAGVVISSFCSALVLFLNVMMEARQLQGALFWVMGSLASPPAWLGWAALAVAAGFGWTLASAGKLDLLAQGDDTAASLGLETGREKNLFFAAACVMTGAVVAVGGLIGFVGLVIPHAARMLFGPGHRVLVPAAALLGAAFLMLSDVAARTALAPAELPVGVITALVGAPFFLVQLRRRGRAWGGGW